MQQYFCEGFHYLKGSMILAVIVYILYLVLLGVMKKRNLRNIHLLPKTKMIAEFLFVVYLCTVLKITGILDLSIRINFGDSITNIIFIPFIGVSIKMFFFNALIFVPYGVLLDCIDNWSNLNWKKSLIIGFLSSLCIELLQLFSGRLFEIDDLIANTSGVVIGYLLMKSFQMIYSKELRIKGIIQVVCIVMITSASFFALSFVANSDILQKQMEEYYQGIGNDEGSFEIIEFNVYRGNKIIDIIKETERKSY